jgi:2,3-bisphosphoglycerate-independent phosphoglycerate mutase
MYRGVARLAGMQVLDLRGEELGDQFAALEQRWEDFDFFYLHVKQTDTAGELGDFDGKVRAIEAVDALLPRLLALRPDVLVVGGDHSSPAVLRAHSWHPVPLLIHSMRARASAVPEFGERVCSRGSLGLLRATDVMPLALAHAGRLGKYGA